MSRTLGASTALKAGDLGAFYDEAAVAVEGTEGWVILANKDSQLLNTREPFSAGATSPRAQGAPLVSAPIIYFTDRGPVLKSPVIAVLAPELSVSPPRYNIGVCFEPSVIQAILDQTKLPEGSIAGIVDANFRVMARTRDAGKWLGQPAANGLVQRIKAGVDGFAKSTTLDGVPSLVYLSKPSRYGWTSSIAIPLSAFASSAWRITAQAVAASGLLLGIGLAWAYHASQRISRPVLALRAAANQLTLGAIPPKLDTGVQEADEVSAALHQAGLRSQEATASLEHRVTDAVNAAREAQAKLLNGQKHEAIGRLTGGIAHDFNNLLQTISVGLQVMEMTSTDNQRGVLNSCRRATAKAAELVRQMLAFGKAAQLAPQPIDFADFIVKTQELAGKAVGAKIELVASVEPHLLPVFADPVQLELALLNLVFNARDAMPEGGKIAVTATAATPDEISQSSNGGFARIDVADDGLGMDEQTLARALEPYFTTKPVGAGSGLGLPQVETFAKRSGGEVRLRSSPGSGTCVSLFLPFTKEAVKAPASNPQDLQAASLRILMVEDDALVSSVVVPALEGAGHAVTLCTSADAAVPLLSSGSPFDVVFTDVVMPGKMTGMDLAAWCAATLPAMGVVVATGFTNQRRDVSAEVLHKPYEMETLLRALREAVQRRRGRVNSGVDA